MMAVREHVEMSLLGLLLLTPTLLASVRLEPLDFFYPWNRTVFEAVLERGGFEGARDWLVEGGRIENLNYVGREWYLEYLILAALPPVADLSDMVTMVKQCPRCNRWR